MKTPYDIVISPLVTEKATMLKEQNKYLFLVHPKANKFQIKDAIEKIYNVKVKKVCTINVKPKPKRFRFRIGFISKKKKAIVTLKPGYKIEFK